MPHSRLKNWIALNYSVDKLLKKINNTKKRSRNDFCTVAQLDTLYSIINAEIVPFISQRVYSSQKLIEQI